MEMPAQAYTVAALPSQRAAARAERSGPAAPLALAALCLVALALVWCVAELVPAAQLRTRRCSTT